MPEVLNQRFRPNLELRIVAATDYRRIDVDTKLLHRNKSSTPVIESLKGALTHPHPDSPLEVEGSMNPFIRDAPRTAVACPA